MGVDIGSTAVKAVAVDRDGAVLARSRVPHPMVSTGADRLEHDPARAWRRGPVRAYSEVAAGLEVAGVCVAGMVPSLTVVDGRGRPVGPGLLYGDERGRLVPGPDGPPAGDALPDAEGFLRWAAATHPGAAGYWPAQALAGQALAGVPAIDSALSTTLMGLLHWGQWDAEALGRLGLRPDQLPTIVPMGAPAGTLPGSGTVLAGGTIDAMCDQIVAGADGVGDVLVICGATLITWVVVADWVEVPGLWTIPHTTPDRVLVGGPSNAGALFVDWARSLLKGSRRPGSTHPSPGDLPRTGHPERVPVWLPYVRGERVPFHDPSLRALLADLDLTHGPPALERAAHEAGGFVIRNILDRAGVRAHRIVASGGGTRSTPWMQALADATGLPVETVAVHEGAALGAAWLARMAAGLEDSLAGADRWARTGSRIEPDPAWQAAADSRYRQFLALSPPA